MEPDAGGDGGRLVLTGGLVATALDPVELARADVWIADGSVVAVGDPSGAWSPGGVARRDCSGCLIVPGNVCAHTHLYSALARGMPYALEPPASFLEILQRVWWRLDRALDEATIRASALAGGAAALLAGTTTLIDHHASPNAIDGSLDVVADALEELGARSVLCYEVTDRDGPEPASGGIRENERFLATARTRSRGLVGAHASFTLTEETLAACVDLAERTAAGFHVHVAEDAVDQADARARFGTGAVRRLADAGVLTEDAVLAHCVHVDEGEAALIRESGAAVVHNPTSNMNNGVGHAPLGRLGDRVSLGTDGIGGDLFAESGTGYFRARDGDVRTPISWTLERVAEGTRLAGRIFDEPRLGTIGPGAPADLIVLAYEPPTPITPGNLAGHWVFGLRSGDVRDVFVAGEPVVKDGRLTRVDQDELSAGAVVQAKRLWQRLEQLPAHPFEPMGGAA
jgi:putative selenium metabolism protein SsnA